ncbi:uncharacterized protein [Apostichopus japonicus]|uniref:uncharacterized protein n=1 Tax=Stichopus japonicus TaxID=307972 RepID=UPI003AB266F8
MAQRLDKPDWIEEHEDQSRSFKRQKSERTILAETFDNVKLIGGGICDEIVNFGSDLISNIGQINNNGDEEEEEEEEEQHHEEEEEEVFENNIRIRNPDTRFEDGGIKLGIHLRKGEHGFRVHKIIPGGLMDSENAIRENDLIVRVGDVEVTALSLSDLIDLFWESDINATLNLTIIRKSDDETDSEYLTYETRTLSFHINPKENTVSFERNVTVSSGRYQCFRPEDSSSQLYIDWKGDQKYLCVEDGILKFMSMKNNKTEKFRWKIQKCQQIAGPFSYLIRHIQTKKFLCCTGNAVSMCAGDFNPGLSINADDRWFTREDKYFESLTNPGHYLTIKPEDLTLICTDNKPDRIKINVIAGGTFQE